MTPTDENKEAAKATVRIKVTETFRDKNNNSVLYKPGDELDFEQERADDVVKRKLAEYTEPLG